MSIKVVKTKDLGRSLIATEDILAGTVILTNTPCCTVLYDSFENDYCNFCLARFQKKSNFHCDSCSVNICSTCKLNILLIWTLVSSSYIQFV